MRRFAGVGVVVLVAASGLAVPVSPAAASSIAVSTGADTVDAADGVVSLREALSQANGAAAATVTLTRGVTYELTRCGADDDNGAGDLDYTAAGPLTVRGQGATIRQTCQGQRVLDLRAPGAVVVLEDVVLTGGNSTAGAAVSFAGQLHLTGATVIDNDATGGDVLASAPHAARTGLVLSGSTLGPNVGTGASVDGGNVHVTASRVAGNTGTGVRVSDGLLVVDRSVVEGNGAGGVGLGGAGPLWVRHSAVSDNDGVGVRCTTCADVVIADSRIEGNGAYGRGENGGGVEVVPGPGAVSVAVLRTTVSGNTAAGPGAGLRVYGRQDPRAQSPGRLVTVRQSTVSFNAAAGALAYGAGVYVETGAVALENSTVTGNTAEVAAGGVYTGEDLELRYATVAGNWAPAGANLVTRGDLRSTASVVTSAAGGGAECEVGGRVISGGYNAAGDRSCGFSPRSGDLPMLATTALAGLTDNGGPTETMLPRRGGPLFGAIPARACTAGAVDQRGTARARGDNCDVGAAEASGTPSVGPARPTDGRGDPASGGAAVPPRPDTRPHPAASGGSVPGGPPVLSAPSDDRRPAGGRPAAAGTPRPAGGPRPDAPAKGRPHSGGHPSSGGRPDGAWRPDAGDRGTGRPAPTAKPRPAPGGRPDVPATQRPGGGRHTPGGRPPGDDRPPTPGGRPDATVTGRPGNDGRLGDGARPGVAGKARPAGRPPGGPGSPGTRAPAGPAGGGFAWGPGDGARPRSTGPGVFVDPPPGSGRPRVAVTDGRVVVDGAGAAVVIDDWGVRVSTGGRRLMVGPVAPSVPGRAWWSW